MKLIPSSPVVFGLVIIAFFVVGILFGKMFSKKTAIVKVEKFGEMSGGVPSTVQEFASSPKVLPPVPENKGVTTHDEWCGAFNC